MNALELANVLDDRFGNPLGPRKYAIIREAIDMIRELDAKVKELEYIQIED